MIDLDLLRTFLATIQCKTYTEAAERMGVEQPTVSRRIRALEKQLQGTVLMQANPYGVVLTEAGEYLAKHAASIYEDIERIATETININEGLSGELQLIVENFGRTWVAAYAKEFNALYPNITLNIRTEEYKALLYSGHLSGSFVGVTSFSPPKNSAFVWRRIGIVEQYPYASPDYLEEHGELKSIQDLDSHHIIGYKWNNAYISSYADDFQNNQLLYLGRQLGDPRLPSTLTDDTLQCRALIESGLGIGVLPRYQARNTNFVRILVNEYNPHDGLNVPIYLVYPEHGKNNAKIKAWKEFIFQKCKEDVNESWLAYS
ncbi:MAG: LysR family transcriptional regulator [Alphaproteobacteria bacterium]|nr:LysR family transcriptional regulator [Alphaproteobacteria bacterium]OJV47177.1 MAG: hypothetical protein BGO28_01930 [Alphaproteobacteria bacterium 43-37]